MITLHERLRLRLLMPPASAALKPPGACTTVDVSHNTVIGRRACALYLYTVSRLHQETTHEPAGTAAVSAEYGRRPSEKPSQPQSSSADALNDTVRRRVSSGRALLAVAPKGRLVWKPPPAERRRREPAAAGANQEVPVTKAPRALYSLTMRAGDSAKAWPCTTFGLHPTNRVHRDPGE